MVRGLSSHGNILLLSLWNFYYLKKCLLGTSYLNYLLFAWRHMCLAGPLQGR